MAWCTPRGVTKPKLARTGWNKQQSHSLSPIFSSYAVRASHRQCLTFRQQRQKNVFITSFRSGQGGTQTRAGRHSLGHRAGSWDPRSQSLVAISHHRCIQNPAWPPPKLQQMPGVVAKAAVRF